MQRRASCRRRSLLASTLLLAVPPAWPQGAHAALVLEPDAPPRALQNWQPGGGPLQRHAARPGAWVALAYLPMVPGWPVELQLWPAHSGGVHVLALDQAPDDAPSFAVALPLQALRLPRRTRGGSVLAARLRLPEAAAADGVYVLVEQRQAGPTAPAPLWVQLRTQAAAAAGHPAPWWDTAHPAGPVAAPASPLTQQAERAGAAFELPMPAPRAAVAR